MHYRNARTAGTPFSAVILGLAVSEGLGGIEVARMILLKYSGAKLIIPSGDPDDTVMTDPAAYGFYSTLPKPYTLSDLTTVLTGLSAGDEASLLLIK
jgi:hypothetical protein